MRLSIAPTRVFALHTGLQLRRAAIYVYVHDEAGAGIKDVRLRAELQEGVCVLQVTSRAKLRVLVSCEARRSNRPQLPLYSVPNR